MRPPDDDQPAEPARPDEPAGRAPDDGPPRPAAPGGPDDEHPDRAGPGRRDVGPAADDRVTFDAPIVPGDVEDLQSSVNYLAMWAASGRLRRDLMASSRFPLPDDVPAFLVLNRLVYGGATRPSVLADALQTGPSNVSKIVRRLEAAGLTTRIADPTDERAVLVTMTAAGRDAAERIAAAGVGLARDELGHLTADEVETLRALLAKVARGLVGRYPFDRV